MSVVTDAAKQVIEAWEAGCEHATGDAIATLKAVIKAEEEDPFPSMREELTRKTLEAVEWITAQADSKRLDKPALGAATHAVWVAVSGLVDRDIHEILSELSTQHKSRPSLDLHVFVKGDVFTKLARRGAKLHVLRGKIGNTPDKHKSKATDYDTVTDAFRAQARAGLALRDKGFSKIA